MNSFTHHGFIRSQIVDERKCALTNRNQHSVSTRSFNQSVYARLRHVFLAIGILFCAQYEASAQTPGSPCHAHRWDQGAHWTGTNCGVNDGNNAPDPLGIVRCANAADTESGVDDNTVYDPNIFAIVPTMCEDPNTNLPVMVDEPFVGQKISWFNFDVRPYAGIYDFQTIATGNYDLDWALYYSLADTCNTVANGLSGDCALLSGVIACGTDFNGWSPQPFVTPIFNLPTNLYLVVWKRGATNSSNDDFDFTFKARYGCGDFCSVLFDGDPIVTCNPNGSYTVVQNLNGTNTTVAVTAPGSTSIVTNPTPLTFTTADAIPNVNTGTVTVTYPAGVNYNITFTPSGTGLYCVPLNRSGTAPECCIQPACSIDGPATVCPGASTIHCGPVGASGYSWAISGSGMIVGSTTSQCVSVTSSGTCNTSYTLTLIVGSGSCTSTCNKVVAVNDITPPVITCPTVVSPIECPATPSFGTATATDLCDANVAVTFNDVTTPTACPAEYSVTRTWTATDDCGNTATCSRTIVVTDNTAPIITCPTVVSPIECPATPSFGTATATDLCDANVAVTFNDVTTPTACPAEYSVTRTWTATDDCGNTATCSRTIVVTDNTAPIITCPTVVSPIECPATPSFGIATATDLCDANVAVTFNDVTTPTACPAEYSVTRTWTATDDCGNTATCSRTIVVTDNTAPVITCPTVVSPIECPATPNFGIATATDLCDANVAVTFNDVTTPTACPAEYSVTRTWTATDDCGNTSTCSRTIVVTDNTAPVITCPTVVSPIECPATPNFGIATATDACDPSVSITFNDVTTPTACPAEYSVTRTWTATDDCGNTATCSRTIVVTDNTAPVITCPTVVTPIECPATPTFGIATATDACDPSVSITFNDVTTPTACPAEYSVTRTWTATDDCGNTATCSRTITVTDNTAPVITCPVVVTPIECPATPSFGIATATDACDPSVSITFNDVTTPTACPAEYSVTRTWTATDDCGNTATCSRTIMVTDNTAPVITCPTVVSPIECPATPSFGIATATDLCDANVAVTFNDVTTPTACPAEYSVTRTWTATDDCGNTATCSRTIMVTDNTAPVINCPTVVSPIECPATPNFGIATATDLCDANVAVTFNDVTTPTACPAEYSVTRTWTATDDCGNTATCSRTIVVTDNTAPVITCPTVVSPIECPATPNFGIATATDLCDANVAVTFNDVTTPTACPAEYSVTRTWTATDDCGNTATCSRTIVVTDNTAPVITCPTVVSPIECPATPNFGIATATDLCDPNVMVTSVDVTTPGSCPAEYSVTRTWTATDDCGNTATCSRTISVTDNTPPVITCPLVVSTVECPGTPIFGTASATDDCDPSVSITFSDVTTPGTCPAEYSVTRTWTATDDCGNTATCSRTISVTDNTPPVITCPLVVSTVECPGTPIFGSASATDDCDQSVSITFNDVTTPGNCPAEYSVTRTWTATDDCGNTATCSRTISVTDNTPPVITCPTVVMTIECPATPNFGLATATDVCDPSVSITFNDVTTPGNCPAEYSVTRTWTATDDCGNTATCSRTVTVTDNTPPVITCPTVIASVECPATPNFGTATATDLCDPNVLVTSNDVITPGTCPAEYTVTRTWTATDDCGNSATCSRTITVTDNTAPIITCPNPPATVECPAAPNFGLATATDACDPNVTITFNDVTTPGTCPAEYSVTRTWTATDDCGNTATCSRTITVTDNTAPIITCPNPPASVECPATPIFGIATATDACDPSVTLTFNDVTTPGSCPAEYSVTRTWMATDDCGNTSTCSRTISVTDNTAPVITCPTVVASIECPLTPTFGIATATDACDPSVSITFNDVTTPGNCPAEYSVTRTWTATDDCGNTSTCSRTITVTDNTAPIITCPTVVASIECPSTPTFGVATATDACDPSVSITFNDVTTPGNCPAEYSVTRTWTATDDCGNTSTCSRTISVTDNTAPVITCPTVVASVECPATPNFGLATATDACDPSVSITFNDVTTPGNCPAEYSVTRTWTATDDCGNTATCSRTIAVTDNTAPIITCPTVVASVECPATPNFGLATATDACDPSVTITFNDVTTPGNCPAEYSVTRTWTATDDCGNTATCSRTIAVTDNVGPILICPSDVTIECSDNTLPVFTGNATASDACDATPTITYDDSFGEGACPQEYTITRAWLATDDCGNTSTCIQVIELVDTTPPACMTQDITVAVDPATGYILITADQVNNESTDNCGPVTLSISQDSFTCENIGLNIVVLTVTDLCGNTSTCTATVTVNECFDPCVRVNAWVYLEGAATDPNGIPDTYTLPMRTTLNDLQVLPGQTLFDVFFGPKYSPPGQPYTIAPWNYMGTEGDAYDSEGDPMMGDAGYPATVVDWVLVSLRADSAGTGGPVCQAAALLHNDGYIQFVEPFDCCELNLVDSFYVVVEHRNHLIVMSHDLIPIEPGIDSSTITYDFRINLGYQDDPFGFGVFSQFEMFPGIFAMYAGNGDQTLSNQSDTDINFGDRSFWEGENSQIGLYRIGDYNLNGDTNFNDRLTWERNNGKFTSVPRN